MENHIQLARKVMNERWPEALGGFAGGSILRGQGKPNSDIDLIVLMPQVAHGEKWWLRQKTPWGGVPFDVFVHDEQTLKHFVATDYAARKPVLLHIMAGAVLLGDAPELRIWQRYARAVLRKPPPPLGEKERLQHRYGLMASLEDYEDATCPIEQAAMACALYEELNDILCLKANTWLGHGKWRGRMAKAADERAAWELWQALGHDLRHPAGKRLLPLGRALLHEIGGPLVKPEVNAAPAHRRDHKISVIRQRDGGA